MPDGVPRRTLVRAETWLWVALGGFVVAMALLVVGSGRPAAVLMFAPSVEAHPAGGGLTGPLVYTVDARDETRWQFFDLSAGTVVESPAPLDWDVAFRRHQLLVNGGPGFIGRGGLRTTGAATLDSLLLAPVDGYHTSVVGADSSMRGLGKWYDYSFVKHVLVPKPHVYALRTADGRFGKFEIVSYYCEGSSAGCFTIRYVHQGDGSRRLAPAGQGASAGPEGS